MRSLVSLMIAGSAVLTFTSVRGQEIRLSGGYNGSNVQEAGDEAWTGRGGYMLGADLKLGQQWFIEPGVHFMVRNLNFTTASLPDVPAQEFKYTERSLCVPLMLGLTLLGSDEDAALRASILGGPTALIGLGSELDQNSLDVTTNAAQWYLGFAGEVEMGFLFVRGGYDVAMSNVFDGESFSTNPKVNFYHLAAGVRLQLAQ